MKVVSFVGARPQFVKEALIGRVVRESHAWNHVLVHSGQHYDFNMSDVFFKELGIPDSDYHLGIGSGSHATMTASSLVAIEEVLIKENPDALLVYGDTNTTLAGALAAAKLKIPVIHVEAGIRQHPKSMPEEINRVLTDHASSVLCCCSEVAVSNLMRENVTEGVFVTGDVMYDLFKIMAKNFSPDDTQKKFQIPDDFFLCTMHRDFNVDDPEKLRGILMGLIETMEIHGMPVVFPIHPRTRARVTEFGYSQLLDKFITMEPIGYNDLMSLILASKFVVTDSGGLQKEAFYAGKRAVVVMPDTGWREIVQSGWNILCNPSQKSIVEAVAQALVSHSYPKNLYGFGNAAELVVEHVLNTLS